MYAPTPDGEVKILRGVPNDPDYKHTLYWASAGAQSAYFASKTKASYDHLMYVRETGQLRVPCKSDDLDDCNYLMYRNQQYIDKWFYAFVKQVYYVNDNCCSIEFEIDVIQTYFFDIELKQSYIDRQHTVTDEAGDNRVAEHLDIGNYVQHSAPAMWGQNAYTNTWDVVAYSTFDWSTWQANSGTFTNGIFSGLFREVIGTIQISRSSLDPSYTVLVDPAVKIYDLVMNHANLVDGLVALVMQPHELNNGKIQYLAEAPTYTWAMDGYTPKNKKLYTAPFTALYVTDTNGSGKMYAMEDFTNGRPHFVLYSDKAPNATVICTPINYRRDFSGSPTYYPNMNESVLITGFAQCAWASSAFQTYLALSQSSISQSFTNSMFDTIFGAVGALAPEVKLATGMGFGSYVSGLKSIGMQIADYEDKSKLPPQLHGNVTGTAFMSYAEKVPRAIVLCPRGENAKIIDDYFTAYGYAIHEIAVPNIAARPHWTYIKTVDANILPKTNGGLPSPALQKIIQIFDRGTTFWKNPSEVGDYSLNNAPA